MSKNAPLLIKHRSLRLTFGKTKIRVIIGFYNRNNSINWHHFGLLPSVCTTGFEKDHLVVESWSIWIKAFCILIDKYKHKTKFGL